MTPVLHGLTSEFAHGRAFSEVVAVANPSAGGGFTYTISGNYWERLAAVAFQIVTDGNAANRQVLLDFKDGSGATIASTASGGTQAATLTRKYSFVPNQGTAPALIGTSFLAPLPVVFLQPEFTMVVSIVSVQAGDQVSAIRVYREAFDTGPQGYPTGLVEEDAALREFETIGN
jgi:hypothetical protein